MTIKELYAKISQYNYCALHDMFEACNDCFYIFPLIKRLDINWKAVEKNLCFNAKYLKLDKDRFFICCKDDYPFLVLHHNEYTDSFDVHCTDVTLYEDYFMPEIFKYAIRWNKCEYDSSIDTNIKLFSDFVNTQYLEFPEKD